MSHARCACPREGQCTRPSNAGAELQRLNSTHETQHMKLNACYAPPDLDLDWTFSNSRSRRPHRAHQRADHVTQQKPRTRLRRWAHCRVCLGGPAARRASRPAIRAHFFARAERRNDCSAGARATLGDDCDADATRRGGADATGYTTERLLTDADATKRSWTQRNLDATQRGDSDADSMQGR